MSQALSRCSQLERSQVSSSTFQRQSQNTAQGRRSAENPSESSLQLSCSLNPLAPRGPIGHLLSLGGAASAACSVWAAQPLLGAKVWLFSASD